MSSPSIPKKPIGLYGPFKEYVIMTLEENLAFQEKYNTLIGHVKTTTDMIDEADRGIIDEEVKMRQRIEWQRYVDCDPLPLPYEPENIQKFYYKRACSEQMVVENTINWVLSVDERSILTQDMDVPNRTRTELRSKRFEFGEKYDKRVNDAIEILRRIQSFLKKPYKALSLRVMSEVEEMKFFTFFQVRQYIDDLTYRILRADESYMEDIDNISAQYKYKAEQFDIHLWSFKNVPLNLNPQSMPYQVVNLSQIDLELVIPFSALCENMVVRGLRCHFDHLSDHARFFEIPRVDTRETNLKNALDNELKAQLELQVEIRNMLVKQREDFNEALQLKMEEDEQKAKQQKLESLKAGGSSLPRSGPSKSDYKRIRGPQIVTEDDYPVVRDDFLIIEQQRYVDFINSFDPSRFELSYGEINLRKYQILGGIYQINFVTKPLATYFPQIIMTWFSTDKWFEMLDIRTEFDPNSNDTVSKFFRITFKVPESFCHWGEPIPCQYHEGPSHSYREHSVQYLQSIQPTGLKVITPLIINDFNITEIFDKPHLLTFVESVIPRVISTFEFPVEIHGEHDESRKAMFGHHRHDDDKSKEEEDIAWKKRFLSFTDQLHPERLFPKFKKVLPVIILRDQMPTEPENRKKAGIPYEYFSELLTELSNIKSRYLQTQFYDRFGMPIEISIADYDQCPIQRSQLKTTKSKSRMTSYRSTTLTERLTKKSTISQPMKLINKSVSSIGKSGSDSKKDSSKLKITEGTEVLENVTTLFDEDDSNTPTKWTTAYIRKSEFNSKERTVTIWTDRLGTFGLAYYRYQHFPFQNWTLNPAIDNPEEVELVVESMYAIFRFRVTSKGYLLKVSDFSKNAKSRKNYLSITEPMTDLQALKEKMQKSFVNIFPERDYSLYTTGYFCEKHIATEFHAYNCMSLYATSLKFMSSIWNKLSARRILVIKFGELRDLEEDLQQIRITPDNVQFVDIVEVCTPSLDKMELQFTPTWRNLEWYPDFNYLITSNYDRAPEMRIKNLNLLYFLKSLLQALRPLSCS